MKFNVEYFLFLTLMSSVLILIVNVITPIMDRYCKRTWRYFAWILIGIRLLLPFDFSLDNHNINLNRQNIQSQKYKLWSFQDSSVQQSDDLQQSFKYNFADLDKSIQEQQQVESAQQVPNNNNTLLDKENMSISGERSPYIEENMNNTNKNQNNISKNNSDNNFNKYKESYLYLSLYRKIFLVWIIIAIIMVLYNLFTYMFIRRNMRKKSHLVKDEEVIEQLHIIKTQLKIKRNVLVRRNESISSPMVMGWIHPVLYLTKDEYSKEEYYYIFAHELTHVKKWHAFIKFIFLIINSVYWFNPFVHLMRRELTKDMEFLCDAGVTNMLDKGSVKNYCQVILKCVTMKSPPSFLFSSSFGGKKNQIKERLVHIMDRKKRNGIVISVVICVLLLGVTFVVSYKKDPSVIAKNEDTNKYNTQELQTIQDRVINVMNNAIIGDCKKSSIEDSEEFLKQIPFKDEFDFVTYESNWNNDVVDKPIRYAIGLSKKEKSPLQDMFCKYEFSQHESVRPVDNVVLSKYENHEYKEVYRLDKFSNCATLCDGRIVVILQSHITDKVQVPFERLHYGLDQVAYLEDTIKRNVKVMLPTNESYIEVLKFNTRNDVFGSSEFFILNEEEKSKIKKEIDDNNEITQVDIPTQLFNNISLVMDGKHYECKKGLPGPYFMKLVKEKCNYEYYTFDDVKNIKKATLKSYYGNTLQESPLGEKTLLSKEQIIENKEQLDIISKALSEAANPVEEHYDGDGFYSYILTLIKNDGTEMKINLPTMIDELREQYVFNENREGHYISRENLNKIYSLFNDIIVRKDIKDIKLNEKQIDSSNTMYLGMAIKDIEKLGFEINNHFDLTSQYMFIHVGCDIVFDFGNITVMADGRDNKKSVYSIEVKDSNIPTKAGMTVGQKKADMEKLYGTNYKMEKVKVENEELTKYVYNYKENDFEVLLKDDEIKSWIIIDSKWKEEQKTNPSYFGQWKLIKNTRPMGYDDILPNSYIFEKGICVAGMTYCSPMEKVEYKEKKKTREEIEKIYKIKLDEFGIIGDELVMVDICYGEHQRVGVIIMNLNNKDDMLLVKMKGFIQLERIK